MKHSIITQLQPADQFRGLFYFCTMAGKYSLGKEERIKSRKDTQQLFRSGTVFNLSFCRVYFLAKKTAGGNGRESLLRVGIGVPAKKFRKAVDRNRIKRLLREAWRLQKPELKEILEERKTALSVFLIYTGRELPDFRTVSEKVKRVIEKLREHIHENFPKDT